MKTTNPKAGIIICTLLFIFIISTERCTKDEKSRIDDRDGVEKTTNTSAVGDTSFWDMFVRGTVGASECFYHDNITVEVNSVSRSATDHSGSLYEIPDDTLSISQSEIEKFFHAAELFKSLQENQSLVDQQILMDADYYVKAIDVEASINKMNQMIEMAMNAGRCDSSAAEVLGAAAVGMVILAVGIGVYGYETTDEDSWYNQNMPDGDENGNHIKNKYEDRDGDSYADYIDDYPDDPDQHKNKNKKDNDGITAESEGRFGWAMFNEWVDAQDYSLQYQPLDLNVAINFLDERINSIVYSFSNVQTMQHYNLAIIIRP